MGLRGGAHLKRPAHERGHDSEHEPPGAPESERDRRATRRSKRKVAQDRTARIDNDVAGGERGTSEGTAIPAAPGEAQSVEGREAEDVEHEGPWTGVDGDTRAACVRGGGDAPTHTEQGPQGGRVELAEVEATLKEWWC